MLLEKMKKRIGRMIITQHEFVKQIKLIFEEYEKHIISDEEFDALIRVTCAHFFYQNEK